MISQAISQPISQGINCPITGSSSSAYTTTASDYDGTNDYASRGADLTGNADSKFGLVSFAFRIDGGDGTLRRFYGGSTHPYRFAIELTAANKVSVQWLDPSDVVRINIISTTAYTAGAAWHRFNLYFDASAGTSKLYIDDALEGTQGAIPDAVLDTAIADHGIGARIPFGDQKYNGCLSELFIHYGATLDLSVEANRRLFFDAAGKPVDKGADGSTPLGVQPLVYAPDGDPSTNLGSGGNFVITGALTACSTSPTD